MINKLKSEIIKSHKNKRINVFFLFLLFAFIILIFTKLSKTYTNTLGFSVVKQDVPQEFIILNDSVQLNITLKTHGFKWLKYAFSEPKITIDFSKDVYKKEGVFVWYKSAAYLNNTQFGKEVEILNIEPDTLTFKYGINQVKKVPVVVKAQLNFSPGYNSPNPVVVEPDSLVVVGPNVLVSKINEIETEAQVFNEVRSDINKIVKLKLPKNSSDLKFSVNTVTLKAGVEKFTEGNLSVPITIINKPKNLELKYFPKSVNVRYNVSLSNYDKITTKDFKVVCDYSKLNNNQTVLIPELVQQPNLVKNAKINRQRVEFIIVK
ncbi:YbbR-like domain-containing protein [Tamlana sp. 62-3]|uniref:YbbR-like domain-containing protein n=1 Tax=Neotamlana sargassicola TaxID=2883125 RepID=A0A9X1I898_9FLAO|nr:YbbR-like domain-containing protein [Tamlana sargassicola]MCB4809303.1 YbbR-like domain-containing protein [Tamlana sargassicola]